MPYVISLRGGDVPGLTPEVSAMHRILRPLRQAILKNATAAVANAEGLRRLAERNDSLRVSVIPNGVDAEFFTPITESSTGEGKPFRIVFTGRFQAQKNVSLLLEQCAVLRQHSKAQFELHLVGDGPLRDQLRADADRLGLNDRIIWHGWTPREELRSIYQESHCFVNPSFYEGMPNAVLEAMACGKPIVASCVAGNDVLVQHGTTGFLFSLDEPSALRESIETLMDNPIRAQQMGRSGRHCVKRDFCWRAVAAAYARLFEVPERFDNSQLRTTSS